jgi:hypothetical protein
MLDFAAAESDGDMGTNSNSDTQLQSFQGSSAAFDSDILQDIMRNSDFPNL